MIIHPERREVTPLATALIVKKDGDNKNASDEPLSVRIPATSVRSGRQRQPHRACIFARGFRQCLTERPNGHFVVHHTWWIDSTYDHLLQKCEAYAKLPQGDELIVQSIFDWQQVNDVWVIGAYHEESGPDQPFWQVDLKFDWRRVNEWIDESWFTPDAIIGDHSDIPIFIDKGDVGQRLVEIDRVGRSQRNEQSSDAGDVKRRSLAQLYLVAGCVLLLLSLPLFVAATKKLRRSSR